jgi:hypothetical protein
MQVKRFQVIISVNPDFEGFAQCDWEAMSSASSTSIHQIFGGTVAKESVTVGVCVPVI